MAKIIALWKCNTECWSRLCQVKNLWDYSFLFIIVASFSTKVTLKRVFASFLDDTKCGYCQLHSRLCAKTGFLIKGISSATTRPVTPASTNVTEYSCNGRNRNKLYLAPWMTSLTRTRIQSADFTFYGIEVSSTINPLNPKCLFLGHRNN